MKLWNVFTAVWLVALFSIGCGDIGVGADVEVEDEIEDEMGPDVQSLTVVPDIPAPEANSSFELTNQIQNSRFVQANETSAVTEAERPPLYSANTKPSKVDDNYASSEQPGSTVNSNLIPEKTSALEELQETVVFGFEGSNSPLVPDESNNVAIVIGVAPAADLVAPAEKSSKPDTKVDIPVAESPADGSVDAEAKVAPVMVLSDDEIDSPRPESSHVEPTKPMVFENVDVEALSTGIDGNFVLGGGTEALLDQLDEATQQIASLKAAKVALKAALATSTDNELRLNDQLNELRGQVVAVSIALATAQSENQSRANITSTQLEEHTKQHAEQVRLLTDRLAVAERNASTLEIRARLEKNEKVIARLSTDNCLMELEAARHLHQEEVDELRKEIANLKKQGGIKGVLGTSHMAGLPSAGGDAMLSAPAPSSATATRTEVPKGRRGTCDAAQCVDSLLSKYVFFWAAEHQTDDDSKPKTARSTTTTATTAASSATSPSATLAEATPKAPAVAKAGRSDAEFDRVGDEESAVLVALRVLQQGASTAWSVCSTHVQPLLYRMLKYEFQLAAMVVKVVYEGVGWLWNSVLSPLYLYTLLPTAQNVYYTQILPFVNSTLYPWYRSNLEQSVNARLAGATAHWVEHYDEWFGYYVADPFEFLVGRVYIAQYFVVKFFTSEDLGEHLQAIGGYAAGFVPSVIAQLSSIGALQSYFGDNCVTAVSVLVYSSVALFVFLLRRVLLGVVAFAAVLMLSPLLVAVYLCAKLLGMFRPRRKTKRVPSGRPSRTAREGQQSGQHRRESSSGGHTAAPPQIAMRQPPLDVPLTGAAPPGRDFRSSAAVGSGGSVSGSASGRPPQGRNAGAPPVVGKYASGLPPRQGYARGGEVSQGGSGSNSGESLSKLGAPPIGAWANTEPEV